MARVTKLRAASGPPNTLDILFKHQLSDCGQHVACLLLTCLPKQHLTENSAVKVQRMALFYSYYSTTIHFNNVFCTDYVNRTVSGALVAKAALGSKSLATPVVVWRKTISWIGCRNKPKHTTLPCVASGLILLDCVPAERSPQPPGPASPTTGQL